MDLKKVAKLVKQGKNMSQIAKAMGITRQALYKARDNDPEIAAVLTKAKKNNQKKVLDYAEIEKLAGLGCTEYEIAWVVGITPETFYARKPKDPKLREAIDRGSNDIKIALRRSQLKVAMPDDNMEYKGNVTMLIWLGKQYLKQTDQPRDDTGKDTESDGMIEALKATAKDDWKEARAVHLEATKPETEDGDELDTP